jgi:hypothetical protein
MKKPKEKESLCWRCYIADHFFHDGFYCSWSANFIPVSGWSAEPTEIVSTEIDEIIDSFRVDRCPLFVGDKAIKKGRG